MKNIRNDGMNTKWANSDFMNLCLVKCGLVVKLNPMKWSQIELDWIIQADLCITKSNRIVVISQNNGQGWNLKPPKTQFLTLCNTEFFNRTSDLSINFCSKSLYGFWANQSMEFKLLESLALCGWAKTKLISLTTASSKFAYSNPSRKESKSPTSKFRIFESVHGQGF